MEWTGSDALGYRARIGLIVPATNTIVEPEAHRLVPAGVTVQTDRLDDPKPNEIAQTREAAEFRLRAIGATIEPAVGRVVKAHVDIVALAMVLETAFFGRSGDEDVIAKMSGWGNGVPATSAANAIVHALRTLGARRISVVTPYLQLGRDAFVSFLREHDIEVLAIRGFDCESPHSCAIVNADAVRAALREVNRAEAQVLLVAGTNLSAVRVAIEAERELKKPVIAGNEALIWACLRRVGIADRSPEAGMLLREN